MSLNLSFSENYRQVFHKCNCQIQEMTLRAEFTILCTEKWEGVSEAVPGEPIRRQECEPQKKEGYLFMTLMQKAIFQF